MRQGNQSHDQTPRSGNIWGWRFSYISLGIILFFIGLAAARHWMLGEPFDMSKVKPPIPVEKDSTELKMPFGDTLQ